MDKGSLFQLKTFICRSNVPDKPESNLNACEAFLNDVLVSYTLAAASQIIGHNITDPDVSLPDSYRNMESLAEDMVSKFVDLSYGTVCPREEHKNMHRYSIDALTLTVNGVGIILKLPQKLCINASW